jgi:hypothetical protein
MIEQGTRLGTLNAAAVNLANDAATAEILDKLSHAGIRAIVLKGPPLKRWLYPAAVPRPSMDIDLLVRWTDLEVIGAALKAVGWRYLGIDAVGDDRPHCHVWECRDNGMLLELHRSIAGVGVPGDRAWEILSDKTETVRIDGVTAEVLALPARAMHVALHAAQHGPGLGRTLDDLDLALERLPEQVWQDAAGVARRLQALPAFAAGLALADTGQDLIERLGVSVDIPTEVLVRAHGAPPTAEGLAWLLGRPGALAKAKFVLRHVVPPVGYMRVWSRLARRNRLGLAMTYAWRPLWLLLRLRPALAAWVRARRTTKSLA